jgi:pimeloyl-ACP methyl ester carboxylesterase
MDLLGVASHRSDSGLSYRRLGSGSPVLLLHGIPGSAATWATVAPLLADDHDVIVPDLLGFGPSERPRAIEDLHAIGQAVATRQLLDELELSGVTVIGHDFGGPVAVTLDARTPGAVGALGLMATNVFTDTPIPFPLVAVTWPVIGPVSRRLLFSRPALRLLVRQGVGKGAEPLDPAPLVGDQAQSKAIATIFAESLMHLDELYQPVEDHLPQLTVPRVVVWGDRDPLLPVEQGRRVADAVGVDLHLLPGAGHFLPQERPREVAEVVRSLAAAR